MTTSKAASVAAASYRLCNSHSNATHNPISRSYKQNSIITDSYSENQINTNEHSTQNHVAKPNATSPDLRNTETIQCLKHVTPAIKRVMLHMQHRVYNRGHHKTTDAKHNMAFNFINLNTSNNTYSDLGIILGLQQMQQALVAQE